MCHLSGLVTGHRSNWLAVHFRVSSSSPLPFQKSTKCPPEALTLQTFFSPSPASPSPPPYKERSPECVWVPVGSLKFNEQRKLPEEWKIPLSQGHSYQQKPDGASPQLHYLCEIAFSPRKPKDLPPPHWPKERNGQCKMKTGPAQSYFSNAYLFHHLCTFPVRF